MEAAVHVMRTAFQDEDTEVPPLPLITDTGCHN